ncbi:hypothetical protein PN499_18460 [Kamptonema animale CS-326]|uniref:hypothetical protein n=1 Tax=Kamptonema animale TaxID=92934 RepID=UPI00232B9CEE|nr:hypothetical protein [Kamptonema animale]MDB9513180.1 hypothetical protein [Kamptonema animale CS-326]
MVTGDSERSFLGAIAYLAECDRTSIIQEPASITLTKPSDLVAVIATLLSQ